MRRRSRIARWIVLTCALAALFAAAAFALATVTAEGTAHFRGREFLSAGCRLDAAARRYHVPIQGWPGLQRGETAVAVQTVTPALPTYVLVLDRNGRCVSGWALDGGP